MLLEELNHLLTRAKSEIQQAKTALELDRIKSTYLGKKSLLTDCLKKVSELPPSDRPKMGQQVNAIKTELQECIKVRFEQLAEQQVAQQLSNETVDITLPGRGERQGSFHPVTQTRQWIENFFALRGFTLQNGPEIETEYYNFTALNIPESHPARAMHDTFYFADGRLLRTHTSNVQIRTMEVSKPPLRVIALGRVYRCDSDVTHTPMFHQLEGLVVEEGATFAALKGMLDTFLKAFFESPDLKTRFRPSYFPFTEPSAEVDVACVLCAGKGCRVCKETGWLEVLGCGMVHPQVFRQVKIDPDHFTGYAFGVGLDRLAMLRYGIPDLRLLFENDQRFLGTF
jgi:phenylalanyl-tRNA synthetase alpha chain